VLVLALAVVIAAMAVGWRHRSSIASAVGARVDTSGTAIDPSAFSSGACMAYGPTSGNRHLTVFLDAGHGGIDPGGVGTTQAGTTIYEADETLPVELDVMSTLRAEGFRVVVSRTGATSVVKLSPADVSGGVLTLQGAHDDVAARDVCANDAGANLLVGIYYDAGGSAANAGGLTAYDADRPFSSSNVRLANLLQTDVLSAMNAQGWGIPNDGVMPDDALGSFVGDPSSGGIAGEAAAYDHLLLIGPAAPQFFTTPSEMPGSVIEPLYLTDPYEGSIAASTHGQQVIAGGIAQAVEQYFRPVGHPSAASSSTSS
jgi:N-acetylmuramoyl-L-alanine amidase